MVSGTWAPDGHKGSFGRSLARGPTARVAVARRANRRCRRGNRGRRRRESALTSVLGARSDPRLDAQGRWVHGWERGARWVVAPQLSSDGVLHDVCSPSCV